MNRRVEPARRRILGTLSRDELAEELSRAGVAPGATVMAHISMNDLHRACPSVDALALIELLKGLLGERGTLLMVTIPFGGFEADYIASKPTFDLRRTPSRMGLATELFRRMPDTVRSLHPTHSVAAWGAHGQELVSTHHLGQTFGERSPFCRIREHNGIVIGVGVGIRSAFTVIHSAEYLHPAAREHAFSAEEEVLRIETGDRSIDYSFRPLKRVTDRRLRRIEFELRRRKGLRYVRRSGLLLSCATAEAFIGRAQDIISAGVFYATDLGPRP